MRCIRHLRLSSACVLALVAVVTTAVVSAGEADPATVKITLKSAYDKGEFGGFVADQVVAGVKGNALEDQLRKKLADLAANPMSPGAERAHPSALSRGLRAKDFPALGDFALSQLNRPHYGEDLYDILNKQIITIAKQHQAEIDQKNAADKAKRDASKKKK